MSHFRLDKRTWNYENAVLQSQATNCADYAITHSYTSQDSAELNCKIIKHTQLSSDKQRNVFCCLSSSKLQGALQLLYQSN